MIGIACALKDIRSRVSGVECRGRWYEITHDAGDGERQWPPHDMVVKMDVAMRRKSGAPVVQKARARHAARARDGMVCLHASAFSSRS